MVRGNLCLSTRSATGVAILTVSLLACGCSGPTTGGEGPAPGSSAGTTAGGQVTYTSEAGGYSVQLPAQPKVDQVAAQTDVGRLVMTVAESRAPATGMSYTAMFVDYPKDPANPDALLDAAAQGVIQKGGWAGVRSETLAHARHPGRRIRFTAEEPQLGRLRGEGRLFLVGRRLYQLYAAGPEARFDDARVQAFFRSFSLHEPVELAAAPGPTPPPPATAPAPSPASPAPAAAGPAPKPGPPAPKPEPAAEPAPPQPAPAPAPVAGAPGRPVEPLAEGLTELPNPEQHFRRPEERFRVVAPEGGVLVGVRVGYGRFININIIGSIQPIYRVGDMLVDGPRVGADIPFTATTTARPGYSVGAVHTRTGLTVNGFQFVYFQDEGDHLDSGDFSKSEWLGDNTGGRPTSVPGGGRIVVGLQGTTNGRAISRLGLVVRERADGITPDSDAP